ncbi:hypothetical protein [Natrinema salinisoli]|uniref:hypothetical protein n=1 Tax=Natrinema salinisoli TaxID=2878535 RepID=UPI001CEFFB7E|nr:hypothetical protein [Natrinema salinisoli]
MDDPTSDPDSDTGGEGDAETPVHPAVEVDTEVGAGDDGVTGTVIDTVAGTPVYTAADDEAETDADWMEPVDRRLLEFMHSEDVFEPTGIEEEGICPAKYAAYRCRELTKYGLLDRLMPGVYEVTDAGERYLADDLDPSELEPDE